MFRTTFYQNAAVVLSAFMRCGAQCLDDFYSTVRGKALQGGYITVLHTHGRNGQYHPYLHVLATSGGYEAHSERWEHLQYLPYAFLRRTWQWHLLTMLRQTLKTEAIQQLVDTCFRQYPDGLVTNVQKGAVPAQAHSVARYVAKYVVSPPIAVRRIDRYDGRRVVKPQIGTLDLSMSLVNENLLTSIVLFGWIPVVFFLFLLLPPRRAVGTSLLIGWLFLPVANYNLPGFLDYNKTTATCLSVFLAAAILDKDKRLWNFRPTKFDLPMLVWCLCPLATAVRNGLGMYDGLSAAIQQIILWGLPYMMGKAYFGDFEGLRELAIVLFIGGLIYIPLCLYEIKMSPQLHNTIYGFHQHDFSQTRRFSGWRPTVFLPHGLAVGLFMCMTSLIGTWLWYRMPSRIFPGRSVGWLVVLLIITSVLVKSSGALALLVLGLLVLFLSTMLRSWVLVLLLLVSFPLYTTARTVGGWSGDQLLALAQLGGSEERVESLLTRLRSEYYLVERAKLQPLLGWGAWGRSLVGDENYNVQSREGLFVKVIPDGFWIVIFGMYGLVGLASITIALLMPLLLLIRRLPASSWATPELAPVAVLTIVLGLYMLDNLMNYMANPLFTVVAGGVTEALRRPQFRRIKPLQQPLGGNKFITARANLANQT